MRFRTSFRFAAALCAVVMLGVEARAVSVSWNAAAGDYGDAANWSTGILPSAGDKMSLTNGGTATISTAQVTDMLDFRIYGDSTLVVEPGGALGTTGWSFLGKSGSAGQTATMTMNGGLVAVDRSQLNDGTGKTASFVVGRDGVHGILNMNGGLLSVEAVFKIDDKANGGGEVHLFGGKITAADFSMDAAGNSALMDITDGVMEISMDIEAYIDAQIANNVLTGYGGAGMVKRSYDPASGITSVWAENIPEPTSIVLLGLASGLLAMGRRR